jgi:hypothetical protein
LLPASTSHSSTHPSQLSLLSRVIHFVAVFTCKQLDLGTAGLTIK